MNVNDDNSQDVAEQPSDSPTMEGSDSVMFASPPIVSRADNNWQSGADNGGASDRKRSRRALADDGALDDIMGQITSKLTTLSTNELTEENSISAFVDVLNCPRTEAEFYLESSNWNVETAVMLWLENNSTSYTSASHIYGVGTYAERSFYPTMMPSTSSFQKPRSQPKFRSRTVVIQDLPSEWTARVSKHTGYVYFVHSATGATQYCVPAGYADLSGGTESDALDLSNDRVPNNTDEENENDMEDDSKDSSMEAGGIEPVSPMAEPHGFITTTAFRPRRSGKKHHTNTNHTSSNNSNTNERSAFRDAMDEYHSDQSVHSGHSASSSKAVWDEGSGYSLNDPAYSVSSTTTNNSSVDENSVFGHMASHNPSHTTFASTNTNITNPAHFSHTVHAASTLSSNPTSHNQPYYATGATNNNFLSSGQYLTQENTPTEGSYHYTSGIAMQSSPPQESGNISTNNNNGSNSDNNGYFVGPPGGESSHASNNTSTTSLSR